MQVRLAVGFLTERCHGGVLHPSDNLDDTGYTVLDALKSKHPDPRTVVDDAFLECDVLPPLVDVDITGLHIERVARQLQGAGGPRFLSMALFFIKIWVS